MLALLLIIIQISFISALPSWFSNINIVLVTLIIILVFGNFRTALLWAVIVGALWDMFLFSLFGLNIFALLISISLANFLLENFLTNRSLYTFLALTMFTSLLYELSIFLVTFLFSGYFISLKLPSNFWINELSKIAVNMILAFALFYIISFFSKRFKPMFLIR